MSERIRQLEEALHDLHSQLSPAEHHPLLRQDLLSIKKSPELFGMDGSAATYTRHPNARTSPENETDSLQNDLRLSGSPSRNTYDEVTHRLPARLHSVLMLTSFDSPPLRSMQAHQCPLHTTLRASSHD